MQLAPGWESSLVFTLQNRHWCCVLRRFGDQAQLAAFTSTTRTSDGSGRMFDGSGGRAACRREDTALSVCVHADCRFMLSPAPDEFAASWLHCLQVEYGHNSELERHFGCAGPFWGRQYYFWHNGKPLTLIHEVFSNSLQTYLGPLHTGHINSSGNGSSDEQSGIDTITAS